MDLDERGVEAAAYAIVDVMRAAAPGATDLPDGGIRHAGAVTIDGETLARAAVTAYLGVVDATKSTKSTSPAALPEEAE